MEYEAWKRRPVNVVQVLTALLATASGAPGAIRSRNPPDGNVRSRVANLASRLRWLMDRHERRRLVERLIAAPESRGGVLRAQIRLNLVVELIDRLGLCRACRDRLGHEDDGEHICRWCNQCQSVKDTQAAAQ